LVLAECEYKLGFIKEAEDIYAKLIELDPGLMEPYLDWSYVKYKEGHLHEAVELLMEGMILDPLCHQYYYRLVVYLYELGKTNEAQGYLEKGLQLFFSDYFLIFEIAPKLRKVQAITDAIEAHRPN